MKKLLMAGILALAIIPVAVVLTACGASVSVPANVSIVGEGAEQALRFTSPVIDLENLNLTSFRGYEVRIGTGSNARFVGLEDFDAFQNQETGVVTILLTTIAEADMFTTSVTSTMISNAMMDDDFEDPRTEGTLPAEGDLEVAIRAMEITIGGSLTNPSISANFSAWTNAGTWVRA